MQRRQRDARQLVDGGGRKPVGGDRDGVVVDLLDAGDVRHPFARFILAVGEDEFFLRGVQDGRAAHALRLIICRGVAAVDRIGRFVEVADCRRLPGRKVKGLAGDGGQHPVRDGPGLVQHHREGDLEPLVRAHLVGGKAGVFLDVAGIAGKVGGDQGRKVIRPGGGHQLGVGVQERLVIIAAAGGDAVEDRAVLFIGGVGSLGAVGV